MRVASDASGPDLADLEIPRPRAAPIRWADLRLRVISAAILAPVALACVWFGGTAWAVLLCLVVVMLALEWARLCGLAKADRGPWALVCAVLLAAGLTLDHNVPAAFASLLAGGVVIWALNRSLSCAAGIAYVGLSAIALLWLRDDRLVGRGNVLFVVLIVWASDIAAYAAGRLIGGAKLAPSISPGKTWSGAAGGLAGALAVGVGAALWDGTAPAHAAIVAAGLGVVSQAGDLFESGLKRHFGVKDSGQVIPGHGGLLDRLDGLLAAAPAAWLLAALLGRGARLWQ